MIIFKKGEWKIFWPFYLALFIGISTPGIFVIQTLFFLSRGFTLTQLGIGFGLVSLFTLLAEIPTGAVADIFGKKTSIQVHWLLHTITSFSFIFVQSPWQMYLLFSIEGISGTFASGAFDALPYEMCKKAKRKDLINEFYAKISMITQFSHVIAYFGTVGVLFLLGSEKIYTVFGMTFRGMDFLWPIGGLGYFFAFLIFFNVKEEVKREKVNIKKNFVKTYRLAFEGIKYSCTHHVIRKLFIASFFLAGSFVLFAHHVHQSFLIGFGFNAEKIAIIIALAAIIGTIFSLIPKSIEKKFKTEKQFIQFTIILQLGLLLALVFFSKNLWFGLFFFFIYYNIHRTLREPIFAPFKQLFMKDKIRATVGSVDSLFSGIAGIIFFPLGGYLIDNFGVVNAILFAVIPLIIGWCVLLSLKINKRVSH